MHHILKQSDYQDMYQFSILHPEEFWDQQADRFVSWYSHWNHVKSGDFNSFDVRWFEGATLNACYNCLDRHLAKRGNQTAILWEGDDPKDSKAITYAKLHEQVCRFANVLKKQGVQKGDRVCIYLPMIPEIAIAMLACARIGAVHSVVFGGFSPESLKARILDSDSKLVITADEGVRGGKIVPLKRNVDEALKECPNVTCVIVVNRTNGNVTWNEDRDIWYQQAIDKSNVECPAQIMNAEDPLFILYTSGSTGKPKGVIHSTAGYLVYVATTFKYIFDYTENEIYWCTADAGWITGHSYLIYGPLCNGATTLIFEGVPQYPTYSRYWEIIDKYQVNIFYTSPTAIRSLRKEGEAWVKSTSRKSLRVLGTVGEPINPDVWEWYHHEIGEDKCPIVDTWWQTETGGILISPLPGTTPLKPGSACWPFFGIVPAILDDNGNKIEDERVGNLVIAQPWPGMMKTIYKDQQRFIDTYLKDFPGFYLTGDGAYCDKEGYYWINGRNDDVIKISGHRIGTGEVESALLTHPAVSEAAVVSIPHEIKGHGIYAFVTPKTDIIPSDPLKKELIAAVRNKIGAIATPEEIQWAPGLPKTRSGKIMRRILRKIANNELENLGDLSTLADPGVIDDLIRKK